MMADSSPHFSRLSSSLTATRPARRRRRARGVLSLVILLGVAAVLLSLAVMFLPLSHPRVPIFHGAHRTQPALVQPLLIPSLG